jgi:hypothetical protein
MTIRVLTAIPLPAAIPALAAIVALTAVGALAHVPAQAAFEVRDASPSALGSASMDLVADPMFADPRPPKVRLSASHATLYSAEGLTVEEAALSVAAGPAPFAISIAQIGVPGAREVTARFRVHEVEGRTVALALTIERLTFLVDQEPALSGWTAGAALRSRIPIQSAELETEIAGDRLVASKALRLLGVGASLPCTARLWMGSAWIGWIDRWERNGARSPRLVLCLPLGANARVKLARGEAPSRSGAAVAFRWKRLEISIGRQDDSLGGVMSSVELSLLPVAPKSTEPSGANR